LLQRFVPFATLGVACLASCTLPATDGAANEASVAANLTGEKRFADCAKDPRVSTGLVSQRICTGADIFFRETFDGNGRTCSSCHRVENNFTIDGPFVQALHQNHPEDPLFVFERDPNLTQLETTDLVSRGGVLENVDGFQDPVNRFVVRAVNHLFSLAITTVADTGDRATNPPVERTGWAGDGAPGDGSLRQFLNGAIKQHYPKTLARIEGPDFRLATDFELDVTLEFQKSLGRLNELDFTQVNVFDAGAQEGRRAYMDPLRARCNVCHFNGGANFIDTGKNRNFDTRNRLFTGFRGGTQPNGFPIFDAGFGGADLTQPNFDVIEAGFLSGFGNGEFNTPPVIDAVDTGPFFHGSVEPNIESAVHFYSTQDFLGSPAGLALNRRFGAPVVITPEDERTIGRFLRTLNGAFNLDLGKQRLDAAQTLANQFHDKEPGRSVQLGLMRAADAEIKDALTKDLTDSGFTIDPPLYPVAQDQLALARNEIALGLSATDWSTRQSHISVAISRVLSARAQFGANITYRLGAGNLMF
jgi:hypothetical protein